MYDPKSPHADDFIDHGEVMETLAYGEANKHNEALIDEILAKARLRKGLTHKEAIVLLDCDLEEKNQEMFALADQEGFLRQPHRDVCAAVPVQLLRERLRLLPIPR